MSTRSKERGKKASFHGIGIKIQRAEIQLHALEREFESIRDAQLHAFIPEIPRRPNAHLQGSQSPSVGVYWGAKIGEVAHCLRSALDHLAWQLVIAAANTPNKRTQFPVCNRMPTKRVVKCLPYPRMRDGLRISGKVPPRALAIIGAVQTYHGTYESRRIKAINDLDIFDKHRELIVTTTVVYQALASYDEDGRNVNIIFQGKPLEDGEIVAVVKYDPPQLEPDPNLRFTPFVTFAKGSPYEGEIAFTFLWNIWNYLVNDFMVRFDDWVPMKEAP